MKQLFLDVVTHVLILLCRSSILFSLCSLCIYLIFNVMFLVNFLSFFNATVFLWFDYCCLCPSLCSWPEAALAHHRGSARTFTLTASTVLGFLLPHGHAFSDASSETLTFESHFVFSSKERLSQLPVASLACLLGRAAVSGGRSDCCHGKGCSAPLSPASSLISWGLGAPVRSPCLCRTPLLPQKHSRPSLLLDPSPQAPLRRGLGPSLLLCPLSAAQDKVLVASLPGSQTKGRPQWRHRRFLLILTNYPFTVQLERKSVLIFVFLKRNFIKWDIHL